VAMADSDEQGERDYRRYVAHRRLDRAAGAPGEALY
jgi:hypothetical protein